MKALCCQNIQVLKSENQLIHQEPAERNVEGNWPPQGLWVHRSRHISLAAGAYSALASSKGASKRVTQHFATGALTGEELAELDQEAAAAALAAEAEAEAEAEAAAEAAAAAAAAAEAEALAAVILTGDYEMDSSESGSSSSWKKFLMATAPQSLWEDQERLLVLPQGPSFK
ncbi:hypothetical protein CYMTET_16386 [Cymbomonas tetramitiformis]|uniref:Uncharacterized protein n=1 Tax=Cymbomonas tetramitiformis TaxID=36881 RepID=A0AAE0L8A9_9CHLO|nr:hypothetical protein CYMTET_16386 [Cymbomonas tetramitiformis]